jgi:hypothetical protein
MDRSRPADAVDAVRQVVKHANDAPKLADEINRLLAAPGTAPEHLQYLSVVARAVAHRDFKIKKGAVEPAVDADGKLHLAARLEAAPKVEPAKPEDVKPNDLLYRDESPGLRGADFSAAGHANTVRQAVSGEKHELVRVHEPAPELTLPVERASVAADRSSLTLTGGAAARPPTNAPVFLLREKKAP